MKIAIASGKGGTGKSTVATNLAYLMAEEYKDVLLLDCDVEEPNCHIFLNPKLSGKQVVKIPVPQIDSKKCIACRKCAEVCEFHALACIKNDVLVFKELCHGCGGCMLACKSGAISEAARVAGIIEYGNAGNLAFAQGRLEIGEAMSPPVIKAVREYGMSLGKSLQIIDCPPGTSCPVIAACDCADMALLVAEPTPFGLNDLILAADVIKKLGIPLGIVINKCKSPAENAAAESASGVENNAESVSGAESASGAENNAESASGAENKNAAESDLIEKWAAENGIRIIAKLPEARAAAEHYSKGDLITQKMPEFKEYFKPILDIAKGAFNG